MILGRLELGTGPGVAAARSSKIVATFGHEWGTTCI